MYNYGLIGNCQASALVSELGSIDWLCLPRPDSPPIFGKLLDKEGGEFSISSDETVSGHQEYESNTAILKTTVTLKDGSAFLIKDFFPRFEQHGRMYRPMALFRTLEPVKGAPQIQVKCSPVEGWNKKPVDAIRGNSHLRWKIGRENLRLITNMPLTYLCDETTFNLSEKVYFGLSWSFGVRDDLVKLTEHFYDETCKYWRGWVKHSNIPSQYQSETIRSALTLKLHCYEDTGAILAALTSSLPEEFGQSRNWDYRFCWLRDAYFALSAFYNLGHFEEMEGFIKFLLNVAHKHQSSDEGLAPVYTLDHRLPLPEKIHEEWSGFDSSRPVRSNNQAAEHVQNDVYGEMILTLAPMFLDERFKHMRSEAHENLLRKLGKMAHETIGQADAGLWELREGWQEHSFSNLMSWAGADRILKVQNSGFLNNLGYDAESSRKQAEEALRAAIKDKILRNGPTDSSLDASLLLLPLLRFPDENVNEMTVQAIRKDLSLGADNPGFLYRYSRVDDSGVPQSSFVICSFWLVQALAKLGKLEDARAVMDETMTAANAVGLFSEHFIPGKNIQCGNFPQAYSHVGQINAAFAVSPGWNHII